MEVIYTVSLIRHFKQSVNLFPSWWFNQWSRRETAIHHDNGSLDAVDLDCRLSEKTTHN